MQIIVKSLELAITEENMFVYLQLLESIPTSPKCISLRQKIAFEYSTIVKRIYQETKIENDAKSPSKSRSRSNSPIKAKNLSPKKKLALSPKQQNDQENQLNGLGHVFDLIEDIKVGTETDYTQLYFLFSICQFCLGTETSLRSNAVIFSFF